MSQNITGRSTFKTDISVGAQLYPVKFNVKIFRKSSENGDQNTLQKV